MLTKKHRLWSELTQFTGQRPAFSQLYQLCDQTVTVYHKDADTCTRTVHRNAFFEFRKSQTTDKVGSKEANPFLLIIPGEKQQVFVGDKVILGEGPVIETSEAWAAFVPSKVPGLAVVDQVAPKYFKGKILHTEATG